MTKNRLLHLLFSISILMLLTQFCAAQSITWQRTYQSTFNSWEHGYDICHAPEGNFYIVGYIEIPSHIYIIKINKFGDTIWTRSITSSAAIHRAYTCTMSNDSGCVITGEWADSVYSIKVDRYGNIVWQKFYPPLSGMVKLYDIISTSDGGYLACGDGRNSGTIGYVIKIDSQGNLQWQKIFQSSDFLYFKSVVESIDNGYILTGSVSNSLIDTSKCLILKLNNNGDTLWMKKYVFNRATGGTSIALSNQKFIIFGTTYDTTSAFKRQTFILKTDSNGDSILSKIFYTNADEVSFDIKTISPNRYVLSLARDSLDGQIRSGKVMILDSMANIIRSRLIPAVRYLDIYSILPLNNGDIIFTGVYDYYTYWTQHRYDVYALRTDSLLNFPVLPIGFNNEATILPVKYKLYQNYPNPFNPITKIRIDLNQSCYVTLKIYDLLGRQITELLNKELLPGSYSVNIEGENLPSGIFFYQLLINSIIVDSKKMTHIK